MPLYNTLAKKGIAKGFFIQAINCLLARTQNCVSLRFPNDVLLLVIAYRVLAANANSSALEKVVIQSFSGISVLSVNLSTAGTIIPSYIYDLMIFHCFHCCHYRHSTMPCNCDSRNTISTGSAHNDANACLHSLAHCSFSALEYICCE